jgi:glucose-6-phosphate dehydrogenase assembly protein OpcA
MTNGQGAPTLLGGQTQIDIRAIERELSELWKSAAQGDGDQRGAVTRACTLNLVVVTHGDGSSQAVTDVIDQLTGTHPNRAIVVSLLEGEPAEGEPPIDAWAQAHCQIPAPGRPQVCCEQITIVARGAAMSRVPGTILPLLVPDLPVVVWYPHGEPFRDQLFLRLAELADRVVIDSETFADPAGGLMRLAELAGGTPLVGDIAWDRLTVWRELVAQCFDSPALTTQLGHVERVRLVCGPEASQLPTLLLGGWLAARLGWQLAEKTVSEAQTELRMRRAGGGSIQVVLERGQAEGQAAGHIARVEIVCPDLRIDIGPSERAGSLMTRIAAAGRPPLLRSARWQRPDIVELLAVEVRLLRRDLSYEDVLHAAAAILAGQPGA